jgi:aspartate ammonia-lyase
LKKSPLLVTLLNPYFGYQNAAEIYEELLKTKKSIRDVILGKGLMKRRFRSGLI